MVPAISLHKYSAYAVKKQWQTGENILPAVKISQESFVRSYIWGLYAATLDDVGRFLPKVWPQVPAYEI